MRPHGQDLQELRVGQEEEEWELRALRVRPLLQITAEDLEVSLERA